jgi:hypothetical protein
MSHELDYVFAAMGSEVRLLIEAPAAAGLAAGARAGQLR